MSSNLGKRNSSFAQDLKDKIVKKVKVPNPQIALLGNGRHSHSGFTWKSLKYIEDKNILLSTGTEGNIILWDIKKGYKYIRTIAAFPGLSVFAVEYLKGLDAIACSSTEAVPIKFFSLKTGEKLFEVCNDRKFFNFLDLVYIESQDMLLAGGFDEKLLFIDVKKKAVENIIDTEASIGAIKYLKNMNLAIVGLWKGGLKAVNVLSQKVVCSRQGSCNGYIMCLEYIEKRKTVVSGGDDGKISVWFLNGKGSLRLMKVINVAKAYVQQVRSLQVLQDKYLFFAFRTKIVILDIFGSQQYCVSCFHRMNKGSHTILYLKGEEDDKEGAKEKEKGKEKDVLFLANENYGMYYLKDLEKYFLENVKDK